MWKMALSLAPMLIGTVSKGVGFLTNKAESNKGGTLGAVLGGAGLFSNPDFMGFLADMLVKAAELIRAIPPQ